MTKTGADISHHQATFDAARYKAAGHEFILLKATEGGGFTDPAFIGRWLDAGSVGLPRGCYHFARPGGATGDAQADHFVALMRRSGFTHGDVWCLDLEDAGGRGPMNLLTWADRWCERVRAALGGPGLFYSYPHFIRDQLGNPGRIPGGCLGWWARYASTPYGGLFRPGGWPDPPAVWQCSNGESGCVTDVTSVGRCDYNRMTDEAFAELFGGQDTQEVPDVTEEQARQLAAVYNALIVPGTTSPEQTVNLLFERVRTIERTVTAEPVPLEPIEGGPLELDAAAVEAIADKVADKLAARLAE